MSVYNFLANTCKDTDFNHLHNSENKMGTSARSFIYVFNDEGKFKTQHEQKNQDSSTQGSASMCTFNRHAFLPTQSQDKKRCSGCSRFDLIPAAQCEHCPYRLCGPCAQANNVLPSKAKSLVSHELFSVAEEKFESDDMASPSPAQIPEKNQAMTVLPRNQPRALFPVGRTIVVELIKSGGTRDLHERLSVFVNSIVGGESSCIEHITIREDLGKAWIVLHMASQATHLLGQVRIKNEVDLMDGWKVKWSEYHQPTSRTVYAVVGLHTTHASNSTFAALLRTILEEQLRILPSDIDLLLDGGEHMLVIFSHGEHDVSFTRSIFLPTGQELKLCPTSTRV